MGVLLPWIYDAKYLSLGIKHYINYPEKHALVSGQTGSGKSVALALLLARIARHKPSATLYLLDYKADDFSALMGYNRYYPYTAVEEGMRDFDAAFHARLDGTDPSRAPLICCVDEWGAFITSIDKKAAEEYKRLLSTWLMLGRSLGAIVIIGVQRPDATSYFTNSGIRDQFGMICTLGTQSSESIQMLYSYHKDMILPVTNIGEGYVLIGGECHHVQVPFIRNQAALVEEICKIVD